MATLRSKKTHHFDFACDGHPQGKITWEYNTTSDYLTVYVDYEEHHTWGGKIAPYRETIHLDCAKAGALLEALKEWMET